MANVTVAGASYSDVPAVDLPQTGGGTVRFVDSSAVSNDFIITVSWDDDYYEQDYGAWVPDKTYSEIQSAVSSGKTLAMQAVSSDIEYAADCEWDSEEQWLVYAVFTLGEDKWTQQYYFLDSYGLEEGALNEIEYPSGTINITSSGTISVYEYENASVPNADWDSGTPTTSYTTQSGQRKWNISPTIDVFSAGWMTAGTKTGTRTTYNAVAANTTVTPSTSSQTIGGSNYMMEGAVTVNAMPSGAEGTPVATKGSVSNHAVSVTPSVINTAGYISGGTHTGTAVSVSASELVSGNLPITQNGTGIDVANYATVSVDVSGGGSSLHTDTSSATPSSASTSISFTGLSGEPTSFYIVASNNLATGAAPYKTAAVVFDGTNVIGQTITNTSNAQVTYDGSGFSKSYSNGTLTVTGQTQWQAVEYLLFYSYGGGAVDTIDVQVGSGATSIEFDNLADEPAYWSVIFKSNFSTSSGYQRVIAVGGFNSEGCLGLAMGSGAVYSETYWTAIYSNGTLTLTSQGTNAGGYFHQPGYYQLTYAYDAAGNYQSKTVTPTESQQTVTADTGYDALKKVTVNAIPSQYIVPSGNISITSNTSSGQSLDVSQYATATVSVPTGGGGSWTVKQTTWTPSNTSTVSHTFSSLSGTPKAAVLRCTAQLTRSSSNTYYYIADIIWDGTDAWGNYHLRSNGTFNNVAKDAASGFNVTTGTNSITFSSDATSRASAPGSFYNGAYELTYWY